MGHSSSQCCGQAGDSGAYARGLGGAEGGVLSVAFSRVKEQPVGLSLMGPGLASS